MANYSFRDLIAPLPESDFFDEHFASEPAFVGGETDKFESLWGWNDLNTILSKTRHWTEQTCRLVKNGSPVPPESFCVVSQKRDQIGIGRPDYERLGKIIQEGAVLHLDRMESLRPTLAATTANLRSIFCAPIEARLTYYRKAQPLTETRFENHDLFLMQIVSMVLHLLPDFEQFVEVQYLSYGYNIPWDMLIQHTFSVLSFLITTYVLGYFILKSRELAR